MQDFNEIDRFLIPHKNIFNYLGAIKEIESTTNHNVKAVEYFIQQLGVNVITQLTYQRKNEYFAKAQPSCFGDDIK